MSFTIGNKAKTLENWIFWLEKPIFRFENWIFWFEKPIFRFEKPIFRFENWIFKSENHTFENPIFKTAFSKT